MNTIKLTLISVLTALVYNFISISEANAQNIGINGNGNNAHSSALLDVDAVATPSLGVLIPRIALQAINVAAPVNSPATSLLLYNTATASSGTNAITPGYYYWDGVKWVRFNTGTSTGDNLGNHTATTTLNMNNNFINNAQGSSIFAQSNNTSTSYIDAPIQLREAQFATGVASKAPRLSFHWAGVVASQIGLESTGRIAILNNPGTGYEDLVAKNIYSDYINTTDNAVATGVTGIMVKAGDNFHRTGSAASILSFLGVTAPTGDNLGNHTATVILNMTNHDITNIAEAYANGWFRNNSANTGLYNQVTGTGIYSPSAGVMAIYNNGRLGISTAAPAVALHVATTDGIAIPVGTTGQQPAGAPIGTIRYNTTLGTAEIFNGTCWQNINTPPIGSTYTQWAGSADPNSIYPCTVWISSDIQAGQFIRATGGNANIAAGGALTNVVQSDAVQNHAHSASGTANGSGVLTTSGDGSHDHGQTGSGVFGNLQYTDYSIGGSNTGFLDGDQYSTGGHVGILTFYNDGYHSHTIPSHGHTVTVTVGNMITGNTATETRPINVAVKFWRRTN